jgi:ferrous iron transport protein B
MMGLFAMAIFSVFFSAYAFKRLILGRSRSPLLLELPSYKWPDLKNVGLNVFLRGKAFVVKAGTIILGINIGLWILSSYPKAPDGDLGGDIEYSYVAKIGKSIQPIMEPIGFDWRITSAIIAGFGAREVVVAALATLLALEPTESDEGFSQLSRTISQEWSLATGCSLLMWYVFSPQCLATFATIRRETMGWKWSLVGFAYLLVLAYAFSWATFQFVQMW